MSSILRLHVSARRIVPTEAGIVQQRRSEEGRSIRGMGEPVSIEVLESFLARNPDAEALSIYCLRTLLRFRLCPARGVR